MVRHVILWKLKDGYSAAEKEKIKKEAKKALEDLIDKVPSLMSIAVHVNPLESSNCDMMLDSLFEDAVGLAEYANHPAHLLAADTFVCPYTASRVCMDFTDEEL